jgi:hypothetical protein
MISTSATLAPDHADITFTDHASGALVRQLTPGKRAMAEWTNN